MTGAKKNKNRRKHDRKSKAIRFLCNVLMLLYLVFVAHMLFFSEKLDRTTVSEEYRYNLVPFSEIRRFWIYREQLGFKSFIVNIFGNIVFFIPIGFLLPTGSYRKVFKNFLAVVLLCAAGSLMLESIQMITKVGAFDIDDIILNTIGASIGFLLYIILRRLYRK